MIAAAQAEERLRDLMARRDRMNAATPATERLQTDHDIRMARHELNVALNAESTARNSEARRALGEQAAARRDGRAGRWAALPLAEKVLLAVAAEELLSNRQTLLRIAALLHEGDRSPALQRPPVTFEPEAT